MLQGHLALTCSRRLQYVGVNKQNLFLENSEFEWWIHLLNRHKSGYHGQRNVNVCKINFRNSIKFWSRLKFCATTVSEKLCLKYFENTILQVNDLYLKDYVEVTS